MDVVFVGPHPTIFVNVTVYTFPYDCLCPWQHPLQNSKPCEEVCPKALFLS